MPGKFTVLVADFLDETSIETPILGDIADIVVARASVESALEPYLADTDAMIVYHDISVISDATFRRAPRCKGLVRAGVGYNNVDRAAAAHRGIVVCNVPDYGTEEVADHAFALMLALTRQLVPSHLAIKDGSWDFKTALSAFRLRGKTFGIVGCGRIGTAAAVRAKAFGMDVVFYDPLKPDGTDKALGIRRVYALDELLEQSHFVSVHCYLDETTHHLIDARAFARMRPGAFLINTARGPVVEQKALVEALESGRLAGAGLDVVEVEPLDDERLRNHPRVLLTPHSAFYSVEGYVELRTKTAQEVRRILLGETPRNPVN